MNYAAYLCKMNAYCQRWADRCLMIVVWSKIVFSTSCSMASLKNAFISYFICNKNKWNVEFFLHTNTQYPHTERVGLTDCIAVHTHSSLSALYIHSYNGWPVQRRQWRWWRWRRQRLHQQAQGFNVYTEWSVKEIETRNPYVCYTIII